MKTNALRATHARADDSKAAFYPILVWDNAADRET